VTTLLLPVTSLWKREVLRFLRQPNRVMGAIGSPLLFWLLIGSGVGRSFRAPGSPEGSSYLDYIYPGTVIMILLFTAIFSTISIIEDRKEGFLQSVLVSPAPRGAVVLGKILGGTTLAFFQAALFLALAPLIGVRFQWTTILPLAGVLWLLAIALTGLGFFIAWRMQSVQGFHAIMNFLLIPLWLLSGALFPIAGAAVWMQWLIRINPLTYGLDAVRGLLHPAVPGASGELGLPLAVTVTAAFALAMFAAASWAARGHTRGDLQ